jgi:hypothetical protein
LNRFAPARNPWPATDLCEAPRNFSRFFGVHVLFTAGLEAKVGTLKGILQAQTDRNATLVQIKREADISRAELTRQRYESALALRDGRIDALEQRLGMLLRFLSLQGLEPPTGL